MMGREQSGGSRARRLSRRVSIALGLVVIVAVIVGTAVPAFAAPPDAPPQPTVAGLNSSILVTFATPFDGGSAILSYTAACTSFDGGAPGLTVGGTSPIIVGNLTNGSSYTCTVFATNADGQGPTSPVSDVAIPTTVPDPPIAPSVLPLSGSIVVSFDTPFDGGSPILSYSASCTSSDGGAASSNTGLTSPIAVSQLDNGKTYTCTVNASNANGAGPDSLPSISTVPNTVPDTPVAPNVSSPLSGGISVSFTPPFDGGSPITGYTAVCTDSNGVAAPPAIGVASPLLVSPVNSDITYTCTLLATNANGDSGTSPPSLPVIPGAAPGQPNAPTVIPGNASIVVSFVAPSDGGSPITGYTATCASSDQLVIQQAGGVASPLTVLGLTNGKTYTCTVVATNAFGPSLTSPQSPPVVPKTLPAQPRPPNVTAGNALLRVSWVAPNNGGFPINAYRVFCGSPNGGVPRAVIVNALSVVVGGVTNGKLYRCNVSAHTTIGWGLASTGSPASGVTPLAHGFRVFTGDGSVFTFGDAGYYGAVRTASPAIAMMTTPNNGGYWIATSSGAVYAFGNARSYGSLAGHHLNRPIVGATATRTGHGYWLVASDGGIFSFGDARFHGSTGNIRLNRPIVGMAATWTGGGYWLVASDGGMFAFGDAHFYGSVHGAWGNCNPTKDLGNCVVGMAVSAGGNGYWIAAGNGTVAGFGSAGLSRRAANPRLLSPVTGIAATETGRGYWTTTAGGLVMPMGDAPFIGWRSGVTLRTYVRGISR